MELQATPPVIAAHFSAGGGPSEMSFGGVGSKSSEKTRPRCARARVEVVLRLIVVLAASNCGLRASTLDLSPVSMVSRPSLCVSLVFSPSIPQRLCFV